MAREWPLLAWASSSNRTLTQPSHPTPHTHTHTHSYSANPVCNYKRHEPLATNGEWVGWCVGWGGVEANAALAPHQNARRDLRVVASKRWQPVAEGGRHCRRQQLDKDQQADRETDRQAGRQTGNKRKRRERERRERGQGNRKTKRHAQLIA